MPTLRHVFVFYLASGVATFLPRLMERWLWPDGSDPGALFIFWPASGVNLVLALLLAAQISERNQASQRLLVQDNALLELRLREERARPSSLRHQVNPHFLFNALNSIYAAAPEPLPRVVFVTAYDQFAIRAFECNAMDYLLKPVEPERLAQSLDRVREGIAPPAAPMSGDDSIFIKVRQLAQLVPWQEISSIRADGNYTNVTLSDGTALHTQRTLKQWMAEAPENLLLQIHRSTLVQKAAIQGIELVGPKRRDLILENGEILEIGRSFWISVKSAIEE